MKLSNIIVEFYERLSAWEEQEVKDSGLSLSLMHTVEILGIFGKMRMKELAAKIGVTTGTLTITIDKLEKKKLVKRVPNPTDRRSLMIILTAKGISIHKNHTLAHKKMTRDCIKNFSPGEAEAFTSLLCRFIEGIPGDFSN